MKIGGGMREALTIECDGDFLATYKMLRAQVETLGVLGIPCITILVKPALGSVPDEQGFRRSQLGCCKPSKMTYREAAELLRTVADQLEARANAEG